MSVRASALVRRHPLVLFLVLAALLTGLYLHHGQHAVSSRSAFELSSSMAHFNFSNHFARLQNGHWHASSGYGQDSAKETSSNTRRILLQPEDAFKEQDGLVYLADIARPGANPSNKVEHPILYLIRQAKKDWQKKVDSQSKDLATAVKTYKLKYGRAPPKGFDRWFKFAKDSNVILVDNYDQIYRDMLPLLGLPSEPLQARSREMIDNPQNYHYGGSFTLWIKNGKISNITGGMADHTRVKEQTGLIQRFVNLLPDMNITIWAHDTSVVHLSGEKRAELEDLAKQGKTLSRDRWDDWGDPPEYVGWEAFCKTGSNLRNAVGGLAPAQLIPSPSFISKHYEASDFCAHPLNVPLHSLTGNYGVGPRAVNLLPLFSHSKMTLYADILVTPLEQYEALVGLDPDWENKTQNKILWRGSTTGSRYDRGIVWRSTQRVRLALLTNSQDTNLNKTIYTTSIKDPNTLSTYEAPLPNLNEQFFDILFTGEPLQCANHDGTCESMKRHLPFAKKGMRQEEANTFKYIFDVDGNGWSGRFHRLMSSKAAVLKSQGFVEWWGDRVQPWVHYIPVKLDYSDLHSIASFFIGDQHSSGHDDLAREIGLAGKEWAEKHWRMEDMEAYMFRLYLEYARVMNRNPDDPTSWDYKEISK